MVKRDDMIGTEQPSSRIHVLKCDDGEVREVDDCVAEEVPVAMVYNGVSHAVMLATPQDLEDFAVGFSLSECIIDRVEQIHDVEVVPQPNGIELQIDMAQERFMTLKERRRSMAGRTGCGLCGSESLDQAMRIPGNVVGNSFDIDSEAIYRAHRLIKDGQKLQALTGATHACAWVKPNGDIDMVREDVGRHNALDKLIGARARARMDNPGFVLTTSRASYEMVQKVATANVAILVAVSAPTGLAIRIAENCGVTLVGFARNQQYVIYSRPERVLHKATV